MESWDYTNVVNAGGYVDVSNCECPEEPTDEDDAGCSSECVSQADFDALYAMVQQQGETIAALEASLEDSADLEATVNEMDMAMTNMATCMAGYIDAMDGSDMGDDTDMGDDSEGRDRDDEDMPTEPVGSAPPSKM